MFAGSERTDDDTDGWQRYLEGEIRIVGGITTLSPGALYFLAFCRTVGQFVEEEIAAPLGLSGQIFIGMTPEQQSNAHIADMAPFPYRWSRRDPDSHSYTGGGKMTKFVKENGKGGSIFLMGTAAAMGTLNSVASRQIEMPSVNGHATARGLGKVAALMACGGELDGVRLISPAAHAAHAAVTHKYDDVLLEEERFAQGGFAEFRLGEQYSSREVSEGRGSIIGGSKCPAGLEDST